jgi:hypothetical protein
VSKARARPWVWPVLIGLLAIAASIGGIRNQYAQDDIAIVWKNAAMHDLRGVGQFFVSSYWPPPFVAALYRPLTSVSLALQWAAGDGSPLSFRLVSYSLYAFTCAAVFWLARTQLPLAAAVAAAALFAVHPVHVEAVALGVNQNEIWVGLIACGMVALYLRDRSRGGPVSPRALWQLSLLYLTACLLKENALVLPALLPVAELVLVRSATPLRIRVTQVRPLLLLLGALGLAFYWIRIRVLSGSLAGTFTAEGLVGLSATGRALTMLGVVPHWFRLLLWPEHLQADYSPGEIVGTSAWGAMQTFGAVLILLSVVAAVAARKRAPMITFGLAWSAVAFLPVHNVLLPTGIVLAERTLFLPSIGAFFALGGLLAFVLERIRRPLRVAVAGLTATLLALGIYRSNLRHQVWSDQFKLWYVTANQDAPRSFRAHEAMADSYWYIDLEGQAEREYRLAMQLAPPPFTGPMLNYAHRLRSRGNCYPAVDLYRKALRVRPGNMPSLVPLIACLLDLGRYREAAGQARIAIAHAWRQPVFQQILATADSSLRVQAPPGTVRVTVAEKDELYRYLTIGKAR